MLPAETILAVFPSAAKVGETLILRPPTLYHAVALDTIGVDVTGVVDAASVWGAAYLLTLTAEEVRLFMERGKDNLPAMQAWVENRDESIAELIDAVNALFAQSRSTFVPGKRKDGKKSFMPEGFGWPLEMGEALAHEYAVSFDEAMKTPLVRAFALMACCRVRNNGENGGPDYFGRIMLRGIRTGLSQIVKEVGSKEA